MTHEVIPPTDACISLAELPDLRSKLEALIFQQRHPATVQYIHSLIRK